MCRVILGILAPFSGYANTGEPQRLCNQVSNPRKSVTVWGSSLIFGGDQLISGISEVADIRDHKDVIPQMGK